ncbi:MAG: LCP family protein [Meiothermus sp.]|uniref:LCP family protein n=1 Tax=Meiothermus sp. TaxID=1955249 RepID=UPI0025E960D4|nr:LCP family protein [Meiothermus sp.]MCS7067541.1 LCP family protein [Meiothermus sp.]MDW8424801.1 LCP family protein [Meiothermus sp.]
MWVRRRRAGPRPSLVLLGLALLTLAGALAYGPQLREVQAGLFGGYRGSGPVEELSLVVAARDTEYCGYHTACGPGLRTDTIFYLRLRGSEATVVAIPRDLRYSGETPAGYYEGKINSVYERGGGAEGLRQAVEQLLGVPVQHYLILTFEAVMKLVDAVDGVDVVLPYPMKYTDRAAGLYIDFPAGPVHLNGKDAVKYMRFRRWEGSDLGRLDRIKEVMELALRKAQSPRYWPRLPGVAGALWSSLETTLPLGEALQQLPNLKGLTLKSATLPTLEEGRFLVLDQAAMASFTAGLLGHTPETLVMARLVQAEALGLKTLLLDRSGAGLGERYRQGFVELGIPPPEVQVGEVGGESMVLVRSGVSIVGRETPAFLLAREYADLLHLPLQTRIRLEPGGYDVLIVLGPPQQAR